MSRRLLWLNGLAIFCVILFHAGGWGYIAIFSWAQRFDEIGSPTYYVFRLVEQFVAYSIPSFLFVSGFFIAFSTKRDQPTISWRIIWTRIQALLIPYLVWSFAIWIGRYVDLQRLFSWQDYARFLLTGATDPSYYFVILLIQLYILSPFLVPLARTRWKLLLLVTALVQVVIDIAQYPNILQLNVPLLRLMPPWFVPTRLFWFSLGMVFGFQLPVIKQAFERVRWVALGALVVLFVLGVLEWEILLQISGRQWIENRPTPIDSMYSAACIVSFIGFANIQLPFSSRLNDWGSQSFGIYLIHSPVMEVWSRLLYRVAPWVLNQQAIIQPTLIVLGLGVPLALMALVRRSPARGLYSYLFG